VQGQDKSNKKNMYTVEEYIENLDPASNDWALDLAKNWYPIYGYTKSGTGG
jgi:hypothetical protein